MHYKYVIVGGGLAAASAIEGIRAYDKDGSIVLMSRENHLPYRRPYLSKDLWFGKATLDQVTFHGDDFYKVNVVDVQLRREVVELEPETHTVWDDLGHTTTYDRLLLATGGRPRLLDVEGADHQEVHYYRTLEDYLALQARLPRLQHALVIGGGFISIELAAALSHAGKEVSFVYPHDYPLQRVLPRDLGMFVAEYYREHGIETISNETVVRFEDQGGLIVAHTRRGNSITSQTVFAGVGIDPNDELAEAAGLAVGNGIEVDEYARTSNPDIYAAGDVAEFPYLVLGRSARIEHFDHAQHHGRAAGANMAGAGLPYTHVPMFYGDLFDLGFEAVGDLDSSLATDAIWKEEFREGIVFYLLDDVIRGVLLWNSWGLVDWGRERMREAKPTTHEEREAMVAEAAAKT